MSKMIKYLKENVRIFSEFAQFSENVSTIDSELTALILFAEVHHRHLCALLTFIKMTVPFMDIKTLPVCITRVF